MPIKEKPVEVPEEAPEEAPAEAPAEASKPRAKRAPKNPEEKKAASDARKAAAQLKKEKQELEKHEAPCVTCQKTVKISKHKCKESDLQELPKKKTIP